MTSKPIEHKQDKKHTVEPSHKASVEHSQPHSHTKDLAEKIADALHPHVEKSHPKNQHVKQVRANEPEKPHKQAHGDSHNHQPKPEPHKEHTPKNGHDHGHSEHKKKAHHEKIDWNKKLNLPAVEEKYGLHRKHKGLLFGLLKIESGEDENAISSKGGKGLFQITPITAKQYKVDYYHMTPAIQADVAAHKLSDASKKHNGNEDLVAADYNGGAGTVRKAITSAKKESEKIGKYVDWHSKLPSETKGFIKKVHSYMEKARESEHSVVSITPEHHEPKIHEIPEDMRAALALYNDKNHKAGSGDIQPVSFVHLSDLPIQHAAKGKKPLQNMCEKSV